MEAPCPTCGEETDGYGPHNLCRDCFLEDEQLIEVPDELTVERCSHCRRIRRGMDWLEIDSDQEIISHVLEDEIDTDAVTAVSFTEEGDTYHLKLMVEQEVDGERLQQEIETQLVVETVQCPPCSKFEGGYYEYVIQLRGKHLEDALEAMIDRAADVTDENREDFVADVEEADGGYDLYVSSRDMAEALLKVVRERYDMEEKRSKELVGTEDGENVYRSVVSARVK
ncbi:MAG: 60S ribosomal export protein NMD3 [Candidatus Nanohaloarchaea archaeon]|nr:60S ribosomal export protein NMD3 [Candidatus Nanohaloarchaea archaeon]